MDALAAEQAGLRVTADAAPLVPAKVYTGDVRIATEADIARFGPLLRSVTKIEGDVDTTSAPITDAQLLDLFGHVQEITGKLDIVDNIKLSNRKALGLVR
jgi:hypothetical protein